MKILRACKAASSRWIATAMVMLLVASAASLCAEDEKNKKKGTSSPPPSHTVQQSSPPASHQAPAPARTPANTAGRSTPSQANQQEHARPIHQNAGQTTQDTPARPIRQNAGQTRQEVPARPIHQNAGQTRQETPARPIHQDAGQPIQQNAGRPPFTRQPDSTAGGRPGQPGQQQVTRYPNGRPQTIRTANGGMVHRDLSGRVREVHTPGGAVITHRPDGVRRVEVVRPGNRVIVTSAHGHGGYVQRPLVVGNRSYVQRTYYVRGAAYARVYRPVTYRGVVLNVYTPVRYYRPAFYAYAYNPWPRPIAYSWGWAGNPWYAYYGGYFTPYPVYASPMLWLTDYLIATTLQQAYQERMEAATLANAQANSYAPTGQVALTPDVKQAIAEEVRRQLEMERTEGQSMANPASGDIPPMFADNTSHIFLVASGLDVIGAGGQDCAVTEGDVLRLNGAPPPGATAADVVVLASKAQDCRKGSVVSVSLQDLQEMQNHMRETIDQGLGDLQSGQSKSGGLPAPPPSAAGAAVNAPFAAEVRPDANVGAELTQVAQEAGQAEQDVVNQTADNQSSGGLVTISLGQTIDQVVASQGTPQKVMDLGAKKIYVYKDIKITFTDGKVSDVQ